MIGEVHVANRGAVGYTRYIGFGVWKWRVDKWVPCAYLIHSFGFRFSQEAAQRKASMVVQRLNQPQRKWRQIG